MILRRLSSPLLVLGGTSLALAVVVGVADGSLGIPEAPWLALGTVFIASAAFVWRRRPDHPQAGWFAVAGGLFGVIQSLDGALAILSRDPGNGPLLAWAALIYHLASGVAVIAIANLLGLFPDGRVSRRYEGRWLGGLWLLLALPPLAWVSNATVLVPAYHELPAVANPYHLDVLAPAGAALAGAVALFQGVFVIGVVLLVLRYRRAVRAERRAIRWLILPAVLAAFAAILDSLSPIAATGIPRVVIDALWLSALVSLPLAIAIALLRPDVLDVDRVLRKSLVYGSLWTVIALAYVVVATGFGLVAGQRVDIGVAIVLTVIATLVFQPARRRLQEIADRRVFGTRADPARLVARLGATLAETFDLDTLLPHIAATVQQGLGLRWVRVRLEPAPDGHAVAEGHAGAAPDSGAVPDAEPSLTVPIVLGDERLGVVECSIKHNGAPLADDDVDVVTTLARQAALAVRNVKLTAELADRLAEVRTQARELERSRSRLVRAQEAERRRIERNIHDGVQQDLVALLGHVGRIRAHIDRNGAAGIGLLEDLHAGLGRVIADVRELAHGIHPTLLSDRGVLEAVESLAARSSVPVAVRADASLRGVRFAEEVEGACYFTIAEALANVLKHARATRVEVSLTRCNGRLDIEVRDDGHGFDPATADGHGLSNLGERLSALGGRLVVDSGPAGTTLAAQLAADESTAAAESTIVESTAEESTAVESTAVESEAAGG